MRRSPRTWPWVLGSSLSVLAACATGSSEGSLSTGNASSMNQSDDDSGGSTTSTDDDSGGTTTGTSDQADGSASSGSTSASDPTTGCVESTWFLDSDGDGHGDPDQSMVACEAPTDHVALDDDCDDTDPNNSPSLDETCDGRDNDCDALIDELSPINTECNGCTLGSNGTSHYAYCPDPLTFAEARTLCESFAGDLLKLDDMAEFTFINGEPLPPPGAPGGYQMGLSDQATEGTFVWTDGTAPSFTAWNAGEPNDAAGNEDCVEFGAGIWNDVPCDVGRAFVCESPPP